MDTIKGTINRIRFHDEESGRSILVVDDERRMQHVVTCDMIEPAVGGTYEFEGEFKVHPRFGRQLNASAVKPLISSDINGMRIYLANGPIKGIGEVLAQRIVDKFGDKTFEIIEKNPDRLLEVKGIVPKRLNAIVSSWWDNKASHEVMAFLRGHGVGANRAISIYKQYKNDAINIIKNNPYRLCREVSGIGFEIADQIAASVNISGDHPERIKAGIEFVLSGAQNNGDCALVRSDLIRRAERLLGVDRNSIQEGLDDMISSRRLAEEDVMGRKLIYLGYMLYMEKDTAELLHALSGPAVLESDIDYALSNSSVSLSESQSRAQELIVNNKLSIVTGGPGVGKTTILKTYLQGVMHKNKTIKCVLAAPTGRAAQRMQESTGIEAKTIHRLLGYSGSEFAVNKQNKLDCDLIVIDEFSMVDLPLAHALLQSLPDHATVIMVGDKDQLASVGPGSVLRDMIESNAIPVARLTEIHRQGADSGVISNAHSINNGKKPVAFDDFLIETLDDAEAMAQKLIEVLTISLPEKTGMDPRDIQILTPSHKGMMGTVNLNSLVQDVLNPSPAKEVVRNDIRYGVGDKVIQTKNNYELGIFNGDSGWIHDISFDDKMVRVQFDRGIVPIDFSDLLDLSLAWAITIDKSQGSEYPAIIVPVSSEHYIMHTRNRFYTAVTRAKDVCAVVGDNKSISRSVTNSAQKKRISGLMSRICNEFDVPVPEPEDSAANKALGQKEVVVRRALIL